MAALPMIMVHTKRAEECNWTMPMRIYLMDVHGQDPDDFSQEIQQLHTLRQDIRGVGKDAGGRDLLYKYFGQLELLERRMQIGDGQNEARVNFTWYEAYPPNTNSSITQNSLAYEKACVIFNMGSIMTTIAATQSRTLEAGLKMAFNYFQCAAGIYSYINENFLHSPSADMHRDTLQLFIQIMLAQAQECFVEKVIAEKKKSQMVYKLAAEAAHGFASAAEMLEGDNLRKYLPSYWLPILRTKAKYFSSLANYHRSVVDEAEAKYGTQVARMILAENLAKEAVKLAKDIPSKTESLLVGTAAKSGEAKPSIVCQEIAKQHLTLITEKKNAAVKDNDVVYHDIVPNIDTLEPLDKLAMAKTMRLTELLPTIPQVVGEEIFKKFVPVTVHEQSSVYSEEKAKLLRGETTKVDDANKDEAAKMSSMGLPQSLDKMKQLLRAEESGLLSADVPKEVLEWMDSVRKSENHDSLETFFQTVEGMRRDIQAAFAQSQHFLDEDVRLYGEKQVCLGRMLVPLLLFLKQQYGDKWTQKPPMTASVHLREGLAKQRENLGKGEHGDRTLQSQFNAHKFDIQLFKGTPESMEAFYVAELKQATSKDGGSAIPTANLLDMSHTETASGSKEKELITKVDALVQQLAKLKKERADELAALKKRIQEDEIHSTLVNNQSKEELVFRVELEKFSDAKQRIQANLQQQSKTLADLIEQQGLLAKSDLATKSVKMAEHRAKLAKRLKDAQKSYHEIRDNIVKGIEFYSELKDLVDTLHNECRSFLEDRDRERAKLSDKLEAGTAALQTKLAAMSVQSTPTPAPSSSAPNTNLYAYPPPTAPSHPAAIPVSSIPGSQPIPAQHAQAATQPVYAAPPAGYAPPPGAPYGYPPIPQGGTPYGYPPIPPVGVPYGYPYPPIQYGYNIPQAQGQPPPQYGYSPGQPPPGQGQPPLPPRQ